MEIITGQELIDLIPQKPPFVLITALHSVSDTTCITSYVPDKNHVLYNETSLSIGGMMENIAQTAAAKMGYECALQGKKIPTGFIGDVKDFWYKRLPVHGETIKTEVVITNQIFDVSIITGSIFIDGELVASCKMKIFVEPEEKNGA